jgi:16S rRNA (cytosine1402-N4)-methyltransferase
VLLDEVIQVLGPKTGETAVDCTLGFGGHAEALIRAVGPTGKLIAFDWDADAIAKARPRLDAVGNPFAIHHGNFAGISQVVGAVNPGGVDVILADLGMSSMQVDDPDRGFSYVRDGPLDMRMDRSRGRTAAELLATISFEELEAALWELGDEEQSGIIAAAIRDHRERQRLTRTGELAAVITGALGQPATRAAGWRLHAGRKKWKQHPAAKTFQTLRLLVNRELPNLEHLLRTAPQILRPAGRIGIISFHSGEDRLVKAALRAGFQAGHYAEHSAEPIRAGSKEKLDNPRSRSAKLRWAKLPSTPTC